MIRNTDEWVASLNEVSALEELNGTVVAIEAAEYLSRILYDPQWKEPLLPALGGLPFAMQRLVENDLQRYKDRNITPFFVFNGLDINKRELLFRAAEETVKSNAKAWELYAQSDKERVPNAFGASCTDYKVWGSLVGTVEGEISSISPDDLYRFLQSILVQNKIQFQVAPYTAWAQITYLEKCRDYVDAIYGSTECLLFDVEKVIRSFDWDNGTFQWVGRLKCCMELGTITPDIFVDACLLSGTAFLPHLPQLSAASHRNNPKVRIKSAVEMILSTQDKSGFKVCEQYQEDPAIQATGYTDQFKRSKMAVKHHVVLTKEGKAEPFDVKNAPGDVHEFIAQRLPDELYFYLSKGVIGPRVLNWRSSGEIIELPPLDGGDSEDYRHLVRDQLTPLHTSALCLLSYSLHRFYQHKDVTLRCWFDRGNGKVISMKDLTDPRPLVANWNIKASFFRPQLDKFEHRLCLLGATVRALEDRQFAENTFRTKYIADLLVTRDEVLHNSLWRFLQLRDYVDSKHCLTGWGELLQTCLAAIEEPIRSHELECSVFLAVEMLRLDLLNAKPMFPQYGSGIISRRDVDKRNSLLISRVACFGRLRHGSIGFTGPLCRHLLAYNSMIQAVRCSLRDLVEVCLTTLLLNGDADRDRGDFDLTELGMSLPFLLPNDCALGIAVKTYFDELNQYPDPTPLANRIAVKDRERAWFPQAQDLISDIDNAFKLWDAIYAGIKASGNLVKDRQLWDEADTWLSARR